MQFQYVIFTHDSTDEGIYVFILMSPLYSCFSVGCHTAPVSVDGIFST